MPTCHKTQFFITSQFYNRPQIPISFDKAVCRTDYDDADRGMYTSVIVLLDKESNARMQSFVASVEQTIRYLPAMICILSQMPCLFVQGSWRKSHHCT
jgi:hypothetical protein